MTGYEVTQLPWHPPLDYARGIPETETSWILLYSGMRTSFTGRYSFLALYPRATCKGEDFSTLETQLSTDKGRFDNAWFGYLGYGLKNVLETLPEDTPSFIHLPKLWMVQYRLIMVFDHEMHQVEAWADSPEVLARIPTPKEAPADSVIDTGAIHATMAVWM